MYQFMYKAFPVNSCLFVVFYDVFSERKCLEQNRCKITFHAVVSSCIPDDVIQNQSVVSPFFGTDL